jgi:hypothetical protein
MFPAAMPFAVPSGITPPMFHVMPPFRNRPNPDMFNPPMLMQLDGRQPIPFHNANPQDPKAVTKYRNRMAAQKWRDKKGRYLLELEAENDNLRKQAFAFSSKLQLLKVENGLLESELTYFQSFMSKMMKTGH